MSLSRTILLGITALVPIPDIEIRKFSSVSLRRFCTWRYGFFTSSANGGPERTPKTLVVIQL